MRRWVVLFCLLGCLGGWPLLADDLPFDVTMSRGQPYVSLMAVAQAFRANLRVLPADRAVNLQFANQEASISDGTVLTLNRQLIVLSVAPYWRGEELYVPLDAVQKIFYVTVHWRIHTRQVTFSPAASEGPALIPIAR
ncbi:stalk domain-containing protein [Gloeobacter kilaueensis]|uniref:Copper amine oxidase-like N-terminal domain-containing protein n=1 Tax=Gloeobacter kilaueensis (strain ATCC BAA-2537 / CCAP 1431/1 / ULC 316 / JS1) TaxID=1183438 RepID=U5QSA0_GLOK1|nr:stalk domain-containing protein [Gloeobacter kilaueensis]AGY60519.1 hypothetical protein GKIL_4273 [Gloeobacter kilaueensis JS1]